MAKSRRDIWGEILNRFDPDLVTNPEWRADREDSPASRILTSLDRPVRTPNKTLLSGTTGIGKSTELRRVAEARARQGEEFVIELDLVHHFRSVVGDPEALQNVSSWEVCFLAGLALVRAAEDRFGYAFPPDQITQLEQAYAKLAQKASDRPAPSVDIFAMAKSMTLMASSAVAPAATALGTPPGAIAASLRVVSELVGAGKWTQPIGKKDTKQLEDQDEAMQHLAGKVNQLFATFRQYCRPVLLVIDGLDRIVDDERAISLLVRSQMIAGIDCALVVCAPFALRNHMAAKDARGFRLLTLHNAPVLDHQDPKHHGPGVRFMGEIFRRRVRDLRAEDIVPPPLLDELAYSSGGRLRDFIRMIGGLGERGWDDDAQEATPAHVADVLKEERRLLEMGLHSGHRKVLKEVAQTRELPEGDAARELLTYGRLLPYPNESEWFFPHPLLMLTLLRP